MDISALKTADAALDEGVWVGDLPDLPDLRLRVRPITAPAVTRAFGRAMRAAGRGDREADGSLTAAAAERIDRDVKAEVVLLGWEGLTDGGEPVPYSRDLARQLLEVGLFEQAASLAIAKATARATEMLAGLRGNSSAPSSASLPAARTSTSSRGRTSGSGRSGSSATTPS